MQSLQRTFASFSIVIATGLFSGCGGPGAPVSGGSDPATEAAEAALSPEGAAEPAADTDVGESPEATPTAEEAADES